MGLVELGVFDFFELDHGGGCGGFVGVGMGEEWRGRKGRVIVRYSSRWKPRCVWEAVIESVGEALLELGPLVFFLVLLWS